MKQMFRDKKELIMYDYEVEEALNQLKDRWAHLNIRQKEREYTLTISKYFKEDICFPTDSGTTPQSQTIKPRDVEKFLKKHQNTLFSLKAELGWEYLK
jgi:hypothetical protein